MSKQESHTHTIMPKKLAEALMEAGVQHFSTGGTGDSSNIRGTIAGPNTAYGQTIGNSNIDPLGAGINNGFLDTMSGIQDQTLNHFQAQAPGITRQDNLGQRIGAEQGRQASVYGQQQNLANQLLAQSQGYGPNPAQAQYAQNIGQAAKAQGALMASQRGASSNPALMARQAAMQGASMQENAAGQAATLQAQQQLGAQQALGQQQQNMYQNTLQGENIGQGALANENTSVTQGQLGAQNINANTAGQNSAQKGNMLGGLLTGGGAAGSMASMFASGGEVTLPSLVPYQQYSTAKANGVKSGPAPQKNKTTVASSPSYDIPDLGGGNMISPLAVSEGGNIPFSRALLNGGQVGGKPNVNHDDKGNDTVPAMLSPGEEVIDLDTLNDKGPIGKAARMVAAHINAKKEDGGNDQKTAEFMKHLTGGKKPGGYGNVIKARSCGGKI